MGKTGYIPDKLLNCKVKIKKRKEILSERAVFDGRPDGGARAIRDQKAPGNKMPRLRVIME